ncbi:MAG TPA: RNA-binding cell elongation regulator Jag/EloR [Bacilli bacterium]|nr:RNA-binding cell elongation regulator Jag/EloR [Bacilli bacterium]
MKEKLYNGITLEDVKQVAVKEFGVALEHIEFETVTDKKGFLGIGSKLEIKATVVGDGIKIGKDYLEMILKQNKIKGQIEKRVRGNVVEFDIHADSENGFLIGKNSRYLVSLQTLVSILVNLYYDKEDQKIVKIDVGGYKKKREMQLEAMADRIAREVNSTKVPVKIDSMNAYERRIIHNKLSESKVVKTRSEGEEPNRYLIVEPK